MSFKSFGELMCLDLYWITKTFSKKFRDKKFGNYVQEIYDPQLTKFDGLSSYLDLTIIIDRNDGRSTKFCDKCDDFIFHIVNFRFLLSNMLGLFMVLIRYAMCFSHFNDFAYCHKLFDNRLLSWRYE